jgi:hypothetical protein
MSSTDATRKRRQAKRLLAYDGTEPWHGTTNGYVNHCCRCEPCRGASRRYSDEWRMRPEVAERRRRMARDIAKRPHVRLRKRATNYGLTPERLNEMLAKGICEGCGTTEPGFHGWAVDHDHACCPSDSSCGRCVRGILCRSCNVTLGQVNDDPDRLRSLISYLERWNGRASQQA